MGAWNTGPFDNDGALDLVDEVSKRRFKWKDIQWAFDDPEYLEADGGQYAIALGALIRIVHGESAPEAPADAKLKVFARHVTPERVTWVRAQIDRALAGPKESELYELWKETPDLAEWLNVSRDAIPSEM